MEYYERRQVIKIVSNAAFLVAVLLLLSVSSQKSISREAEFSGDTIQNVQSAWQCPDAPFAIPGEYVHASYWDTNTPPGYIPGDLHLGVDFAGLTTDSALGRNPPVCLSGSGTWEVDVPGIAPVYAAYDGVVDYVYVVGGAVRNVWIRHENVPVSGRIEPVVCTYYEHMKNAATGESTVFPQFQIVGAQAHKGEQIGWMGNAHGSGSTFTHLHFGVAIGLNSYGRCNRALEPQLWTDPSPFLGTNVSYDGGSPANCYPLSCPPFNNCCCSSYAATSGATCSTEATTTTMMDFPEVDPFDPLPTFTLDTVDSIPTSSQTPTQINTEPPASTNYTLVRRVIGTSGSYRTSASYVMQGTSGQTTGVAQRQSNSYGLQSGYWSSQPNGTGNAYQIYLPVVVRSF